LSTNLIVNKKDFESLVELRVKDARALLKNKRYDGAYYMIGYAVECALKVSICNQIREHDFPDKNLVNQSYTHDLLKLLQLSGLALKLQQEMDKSSKFNEYWADVKDWSENDRYKASVTEDAAKKRFRAVTARKYGVLSWLKKWW